MRKFITSAELKKIQLFKDTPDEVLRGISHLLDIRTFPSGETLFYRGDPGTSMFIIMSGSASVTVTNAEGHEYTIATLNEGEIFGEMALITGEPRTANVRSSTELKTIEIHQDKFQEMMRIIPELNLHLMRLLVNRLGTSLVKRHTDHLETKELIAKIICNMQPPELDSFPGITKWSKQVNETITRLKDSLQNVLLLGEIGSGRELVASLIHFGAKGSIRPIFSLDCANPPPVIRESPEKYLGAERDLILEASQEAALFGHEAGSAIYAKGTRRGYLELADGGTILLQNIEFLTPKVQQLLADYLETHLFRRIGEEENLHSKVRFICTATEGLGDLAKEEKFNQKLYSYISAEESLTLPLRQRKKDIPTIAEYYLGFFARMARKNIRGFSTEAMNALVDYNWPSNMLEMKQVIDRAVAICQGESIEVEHIFLDISPFTTQGRLNILKIEQVDKIAHHSLFPSVLRYVTIPLFVFIILYTFYGPNHHNFANIIAWAILWPFLIVSIGISARSWCGYCPISGISNYLVYFRKEFFHVPNFIKKYGIWFGISGFLCIIWIEHYTKMADNAHLTSFLLLTILGGSIFITSVFGRRVWCLHLCPLGTMIGQLATISMMELRSNNNVCLSQCMTHDCIKKGCPMGLHPSSGKMKHDCILCLSCLKNCPHKSIRIDLLFPRQKVLEIGIWEFPRAFFTTILVGALLAVSIIAWYESRDTGMSIITKSLLNYPASNLGVFMFFTGCFVLTVFIASLSDGHKSRIESFSHAGYAYIPFAFFGLFNLYFREFIDKGHELLPLIVKDIGLTRIIPQDWVTPNFVTLKGLPPLFTILAMFFALYLLNGIKKKYSLRLNSFRIHRYVMIFTTVVLLITL